VSWCLGGKSLLGKLAWQLAQRKDGKPFGQRICRFFATFGKMADRLNNGAVDY
jgi:hypothetical protein